MNVKPFVWFVIIVLFIYLLRLFVPTPVVGVSTSLIGIETVKAATTTIDEAIVSEPVVVLRKELETVCSCESGNGKYGHPQQFNADGTVRRGKVNRNDIGECQINSVYHQEAAEKMGMDIYTEMGNIAYANFLFDTQGLTPWHWSQPCWQ